MLRLYFNNTGKRGNCLTPPDLLKGGIGVDERLFGNGLRLLRAGLGHHVGADEACRNQDCNRQADREFRWFHGCSPFLTSIHSIMKGPSTASAANNSSNDFWTSRPRLELLSSVSTPPTTRAHIARICVTPS